MISAYVGYWGSHVFKRFKTFILAEPLCEVPKRYLQRGSAKIN
jgi:hypothetical protein